MKQLLKLFKTNKPKVETSFGEMELTAFNVNIDITMYSGFLQFNPIGRKVEIIFTCNKGGPTKKQLHQYANIQKEYPLIKTIVKNRFDSFIGRYSNQFAIADFDKEMELTGISIDKETTSHEWDITYKHEADPHHEFTFYFKQFEIVGIEIEG